MNSAAAFLDCVLGPIVLQKAQESQAAGTEIVEDEKSTIMSEPVIGQFSPDTCNDIVIHLTRFGVGMKAEVTKILGIRMAKIQEMIKAKVVEIVAERLRTLYNRVNRT